MVVIVVVGVAASLMQSKYRFAMKRGGLHHVCFKCENIAFVYATMGCTAMEPAGCR